MPMQPHFYQPKNGHGLPHDPFNAIIGPRPIGWISSKSAKGALNLAPFSFFNAFNYTPPIIGFSSTGKKDSLNNIRETGEFCWQLVNKSLAEAMNQTSASVAPDINEFELAKLKPAESSVISVPHVEAASVVFECRLTQIVQLEDTQQNPLQAWLVLGEVVGVHIANHLLVDGIYQTALGEPVLRGGGPADYFSIEAENRFELYRPQAN